MFMQVSRLPKYKVTAYLEGRTDVNFLLFITFVYRLMYLGQIAVASSEPTTVR